MADGSGSGLPAGPRAGGGGASTSSEGDQSRPDDFGRTDGSPIENKDTILQDVDRALGYDSPPALEYVLVQPFSVVRLPFTNIGFGWNQYGHSVVRYTLPNGRQIVRCAESRFRRGVVGSLGSAGHEHRGQEGGPHHGPLP